MKVFNYIWIAITSVFLFLFSGFLFFGSKEQLVFLKNDLMINLINRAISFWGIGLVSFFVLFVINLIIWKNRNEAIKKYMLIALVISLTSSLLGSILFFSI